MTLEDIREFLTGFAAAIELDQIRVDALPRERLHFCYHDEMWRRWRSAHIEYIHKLVRTTDDLPEQVLLRLSRIAIASEANHVQQRLIDLFSEAVSGCFPEEEFETATLFFGWLIKELDSRLLIIQLDGSARNKMMKWLPAADPLRISEDDECRYGELASFVN